MVPCKIGDFHFEDYVAPKFANYLGVRRQPQAMRGKQAAPLVRVAGNHADQICFALDAGARGIVVPMVNTREEAETAVRACRYFPLGNRSNAGVRGEWGGSRITAITDVLPFFSSGLNASFPVL